MYAFDIFLLLILASFDSHDMKPIHSVYKLYVMEMSKN